MKIGGTKWHDPNVLGEGLDLFMYRGWRRPHMELVTIQPKWAERAWKTLAEDVGVVMLFKLPQLVHRAFLGALKARQEEPK